MILPTEIVRCDHCGGSFLAGDLETLRRNGYHDPATREDPEAERRARWDRIAAVYPAAAAEAQRAWEGWSRCVKISARGGPSRDV